MKRLLAPALAICVLSAGALPEVHAQASSLPDFARLVKNEGPAVVNIVSTRKPADRQARGERGGGEKPDPMEELLRRFMPEGAPGRGEPRQGLGSGFIISQDGFILTNAHVVAGFDDVNVRLADAKREFKAKVIGIDKRTDVALVKVEATGLPVAKVGDSSKVEAGEWVAAIGSPFGFANTITAGIVSAKGRSLPDEMYVPFIQTDVAVNPGNSGGPLLNLKGEVVGVNSAIYSGTGGYLGVSFAIPIEVALDVAKQLQAKGKVTRGRIGIGVQPLTKELAQSFRLDTQNGAVIVNVEEGGPAQKAGARVGDVVLKWNGKALDDANELPRLVAATRPGAAAKMEVFRNGKREELNVTVGEIPVEQVADAKKAQKMEKEKHGRLGLAVEEIPPAERKALGVDYGLIVVDVGEGPARGSGIQPGDVIVAVNQQRFKTIDEFNKLLAAHKKGERVALLVKRGENALYVPMELG
ncbi:MAG: DegQ family serine endoprotease [Betaproteobacteria bacterium]